MRHITCEICGLEVNKYDPDAVLMTKPNKEVGLFGAISCTCGDICGDCIRLGRKIDFRKIMMDSWRESMLHATS